MSVVLAKASGNLTDNSTWGLVDPTSYLNAENATESLLTTAYSGTRSSPFTPGAIEIDGIAVKLCERIGTTGTISVNLELDSDNSQVAGTEVTINVADLPSCLETDLNGGWIFFKFASPVTLLAATAYQVAAKTSSANQVDLWCDGTADNLARALRTTTEQAPVAGDDMIITGEKTGAGTQNALTVTMNQTATTDYGAASTSLVTPALAICHGGTLEYGTASSTNYYLKLSGNAIIYSGGTLNIGTVATPIPRNSTAVLEFDPASDGDFGLTPRGLSTLNIQGLSRSSGKNIVSCKLNTDEAANSTSLGVDTDTGWLDNDEIGVASTTRTASQCEKGTLNGNANTSDMTVDGFTGAGGGLANAHSGTAPTQAEVILLTRNVKIRSATSTLMTYINPKATSNVDIDWAEFYYLGFGTTGKQGIEIETTTGSFNMQYSSVHDCEVCGIRVTSASGSNIVISNNVTYNLNSGAASNIAVLIAASSGSTTFSNNIIMASNGSNSTSICSLGVADSGAIVTGNTIVGHIGGTSTAGIIFSENSSTIGTFSNNTIHSCSGDGMSIVSNFIKGTMSSLTIWRNSGSNGGISMSGSNLYRMVIDTATLFGNTNQNINVGRTNLLILKDVVSNSDASFSTSIGFRWFNEGNAYMFNCSFGATTAHTQDLSGNTINVFTIHAFNTTFGSATEYQNSSTLPINSFLKSHKHDASGTTFKAIYRTGTIQNDTTTRHTASGNSWKMTPNNASEKLILNGPLEFDTMKAVVNANLDVTISVYVQKDGSYNGNAPRLVVVGGIVAGVGSFGTDDIDSLSVGASTWEQLSVTVTPTEDGVIEFYVDCDGTAGSIYVDDVDISQA